MQFDSFFESMSCTLTESFQADSTAYHGPRTLKSSSASEKRFALTLVLDVRLVSVVVPTAVVEMTPVRVVEMVPVLVVEMVPAFAVDIVPDLATAEAAIARIRTPVHMVD